MNRLNGVLTSGDCPIREVLTHKGVNVGGTSKQRVGKRRGASAIEYGLIAALIAVAIIAALTTMGNRLSCTFETTSLLTSQDYLVHPTSTARATYFNNFSSGCAVASVDGGDNVVITML